MTGPGGGSCRLAAQPSWNFSSCRPSFCSFLAVLAGLAWRGYWPFDYRPTGSLLGHWVKLVEFGLQELLVREAGLALGNEGGRHGPAEGVFDDLLVVGDA